MTINFKSKKCKNLLLATGLILFMIAFIFPVVLAQSIAPIPVNQPQSIDFSILDTVAGVAAGVVATILIFGLVGYILIKSKLIVLGKTNLDTERNVVICPRDCPEHSAEHERSVNNVNHISDLYTKYNENKDELSNLKTTLALLKLGQDQILVELAKLVGK